MHKDFYCAYHHNQIITNFCKCSECLLPVCQTCVKLHSEQHSINQTRPQYEEGSIGIVFKDIKNELDVLQDTVNEYARYLLEVEKKRKAEQKVARQFLREHRKNMIREFERALQEVEEEAVRKIVAEDEQFICQLQELDEEVLQIQRAIAHEKSGLATQASLKTVIGYFYHNIKEKVLTDLEKVEPKITKLGRKSLRVRIQDDYIAQLKAVVKNFVKIEVIDIRDQY